MKNKIFILLFSVFSFFAFSESCADGYGGVKLGMSLEETKKALKSNIEFGYSGEKDVSLLPGENKVLIETEAFSDSFLERCYFQFYEEKLYSITINLNREKIDHYSVFKALCKKYGTPSTVTPEKSVWKSDLVTMSLEKPLTLKYVDKKIFEKLQNSANIDLSPQEITREMFLDSL